MSKLRTYIAEPLIELGGTWKCFTQRKGKIFRSIQDHYFSKQDKVFRNKIFIGKETMWILQFLIFSDLNFFSQLSVPILTYVGHTWSSNEETNVHQDKKRPSTILSKKQLARATSLGPYITSLPRAFASITRPTFAVKVRACMTKWRAHNNSLECT